MGVCKMAVIKRDDLAQETTQQVVENLESVEKEKVSAKDADKNAADLFAKQGLKIIATMGEEKEKLGSMSGTLHFVQLLGTQFDKGTRRATKGAGVSEMVDCPKTVGIELVSDVDIQVPQYPEVSVAVVKATGIDPEKVTYKAVKAGEKFHLSMIEFMLLITQPEYAGKCEAKGDPEGLVFTPKFAQFRQGKAKIVTPAVSYKRGLGAVKENIFPIDYKDASGEIKIRDEYAEKFGSLLQKKVKPVRQAGTHSKEESVDRTKALAVAVRSILLGQK